MTPEIRRARTAFWWVGVIVPLSIIALATIVVLSWLPQIPDPSAIHWGTDGVNGYGPKWTHLVTLLGVGGGMVVLFAGIALFAHKAPQRGPASLEPQPPWSVTARFLGAASLGTTAMIALITVVGVAVQRGVADARQTPDITPWVFVGFVLMFGLGVLGWFLQPAVDLETRAGGEAAAPLALSDGERAVWFQTVAIARSGRIVLGIGVFVTLAIAVLLFAQDVTTGWIMMTFAVILLLLVATTLTFRVRASSAGLRVRSAVGWPRLDIPAARIASARAIQVNPFAEFGGWGYRIGLDGRRGFVLRTGEALEVTRTDGRVFVITVDDAGTAASVLAAR